MSTYLNDLEEPLEAISIETTKLNDSVWCRTLRPIKHCFYCDNATNHNDWIFCDYHSPKGSIRVGIPGHEAYVQSSADQSKPDWIKVNTQENQE